MTPAPTPQPKGPFCVGGHGQMIDIGGGTWECPACSFKALAAATPEQLQQKADRIHAERQAAKTDPTPQPTHDHGAAGFCTDHAQHAPIMTAEELASLTGAAAVEAWSALHPDRWPHTPPREVMRALLERNGNLWWAMGCGHHQNAYEAECDALGDESACSACAGADEVRADATRHAGWSEAMRFAHHAHADETSNGYMSANGVLGAGPDAVIVDGDWLAQVEADLTEARAALDRVRALPTWDTSSGGTKVVWASDIRAALDPEETAK